VLYKQISGGSKRHHKDLSRFSWKCYNFYWSWSYKKHSTKTCCRTSCTTAANQRTLRQNCCSSVAASCTNSSVGLWIIVTDKFSATRKNSYTVTNLTKAFPIIFTTHIIINIRVLRLWPRYRIITREQRVEHVFKECLKEEYACEEFMASMRSFKYHTTPMFISKSAYDQIAEPFDAVSRFLDILNDDELV